METVSLLVRLEARPGKEKEIESFLKEGLAMVLDEPGTVSWYALKLGPTSYAIFDTFASEAGRQAHLMGVLAKELMTKAPHLFAKAPVIERAQLLEVKPQGQRA